MKFLSLILSACFIATTLAQQQRSQGKYQNSISRLHEGDDYVNVPVRAGYRIMGNDDDGYLEDGIIVKTKGTGYVDPRYRKKYLRQQEQLQQQQQRQKKYLATMESMLQTQFQNNNDQPDVDPNDSRRQDNFRQKYYYFYEPSSSSSSSSSNMDMSGSSYYPSYYYLPKKYLKSEIIYGRREW